MPEIPKVGSFVQVKFRGYRGRVYKEHDSFKATGESREWFNGLAVRPSEADIRGPWFSLLVEPRGAAVLPLSWLTVVEPFPTLNPAVSTYFD